MPNPLPSKQLRFCRAIADGSNHRTAYMHAYPDCSEKSADAASARLLSNVRVQAEIKRLQDKTETKETLTRQMKRERLAKIALGKVGAAKVSDMNAAMKIDNEMTGDNAPIRVEGEITISGVWGRLKDTTGLPGEKL